ncbi:hypothetical protein PROFUN_15772 [Planoprotostelium fungivorum]|uniref:Uncharacterized protein n=1 Tax=Planoprotostelium fungivorum TaxID=1890364 RepID=A0A2P6MQ16_9EUKA|nr:hypothetical protein PROFUN_15772 [Planoprotostelium fungivorum]
MCFLVAEFSLTFLRVFQLVNDVKCWAQQDLWFRVLELLIPRGTIAEMWHNAIILLYCKWCMRLYSTFKSDCYILCLDIFSQGMHISLEKEVLGSEPNLKACLAMNKIIEVVCSCPECPMRMEDSQ